MNSMEIAAQLQRWTKQSRNGKEVLDLARIFARDEDTWKAFTRLVHSERKADHLGKLVRR
jgi:hypothetical protein